MVMTDVMAYTDIRVRQAVGRTMLCLLNLERDGEVVQCTYESDQKQMPPFDPEAVAHYPERLVNAIRKCLEPLPENRPPTAALFVTIDIETKKIGDGARLPEGEILRYKPNKYANWMK